MNTKHFRRQIIDPLFVEDVLRMRESFTVKEICDILNNHGLVNVWENEYKPHNIYYIINRYSFEQHLQEAA